MLILVGGGATADHRTNQALIIFFFLTQKIIVSIEILYVFLSSVNLRMKQTFSLQFADGLVRLVAKQKLAILFPILFFFLIPLPRSRCFCQRLFVCLCVCFP